MYEYYAQVVRIVDGDTVELLIDLGFKHYIKDNCRLSGINAPELNSADLTEREKANISRSVLQEWLPVGTKVQVKSNKLDKYGRPLVTIYTLAGVNINQMMIDRGYAVVYNS